LAWNTTRDKFSKPARNGFPNMPLLTELEILWEWVFYKYIAPTALGFTPNSAARDLASGLLRPLALGLDADAPFPTWRKGEWPLRKARCSDMNGMVLKELPVP
jgi:hypothetical protein